MIDVECKDYDTEKTHQIPLGCEEANGLDRRCGLLQPGHSLYVSPDSWKYLSQYSSSYSSTKVLQHSAAIDRLLVGAMVIQRA